MADQEFLGVGWSFPPRFEKSGKNGLVMSSGVQDINESLEILMTTTLGERVMQPGYGADLTKMLFEPLSGTLTTEIRDMLTRAITIQEPRVKIEKINLIPNHEEGLLNISIDYVLKAVNSRINYVYPFYLPDNQG